MTIRKSTQSVEITPRLWPADRRVAELRMVGLSGYTRYEVMLATAELSLLVVRL